MKFGNLEGPGRQEGFNEPKFILWIRFSGIQGKKKNGYERYNALVGCRFNPMTGRICIQILSNREMTGSE